jgi:RNA polymerase sigma factor (sigma-70 family)
MILAHRSEETADHDLLRRFADKREEAAFEAILSRHGPMVFDVCRRILASEADSEDAFQATFLVLAAKAGSIRRTGSLAAWLHGVASRVSLKMRAGFARRRQAETDSPRREVGSEDPLTWAEIQSVLHEELGGLRECHRAPLVLCYLCGQTQDEAASQLGLSRGR